MALLLAAALPTNIHGFTPSTVAPTAPYTAASPLPDSALMAHARRAHTLTATTTTTTRPRPRNNAAQSVFAKIDKDGNGKIDREELQAYLTSEGMPYTKAVAQSIFDRLDANQDGHLVLEELATGMQEHQLFRAITSSKEQSKPSKSQQLPKKIKVVQNPQTAFALKQQQQQRKSQNNKKASMKQWRQRVEQKANRFFQVIDADRDGIISLTELKEHFLVRRMQAVAQSNGLLASLKSSSQRSKAAVPENANVVPWHHSETAIQTLFQTLDVNADGRITSQDLREAFVRYPSVRHAFQV